MRFALVWAGLVALLGVELVLAFVWHAGVWTVVVGPACSAVVAVGFLRVREGPALARMCAVAGLVWLAVLLGLGTLDPGTRVDHPVAAGVRG